MGGVVAAPAIFMFDRSLRLTLAGGSALDQRGWKPDALVGRDIRDLLPPVAVAELLPHYQSALEGVTSSFTIRSTDGARLYAVEAMPVSDETGAITGGVALARGCYRSDSDAAGVGCV